MFNAIRKLCGGKLTQSQVDGINHLVRNMEGWSPAWKAYALATVLHETNQTFQPIKEIGGVAYFTKLYDVKGARPELAKANGNIKPGDGAKYFGRGYVQLTWYNNYAKAGRILGVDLVNNPDLAEDPDIAAKILRAGMEEGWFTGRKLSTYLPNRAGTLEQFRQSRRIINGMDKAAQIAKYASAIQAGILA